MPADGSLTRQCCHNTVRVQGLHGGIGTERKVCHYCQLGLSPNRRGQQGILYIRIFPPDECVKSLLVILLSNVSEEQYSFAKSQLVVDVTGTHGDSGIEAILFISIIQRNEMVQAAQKCKLPTNKIIKELNHICINVDYSDRDIVCHTENQRTIEYLRCCDIEPAVLDGISDMTNQRSGSIDPYPLHALP